MIPHFLQPLVEHYTPIVKPWLDGLRLRFYRYLPAPKRKAPAPQPPPPPPKPQGKERILVIRLGALGDIVLCFQAFYEIREAHKNAEIAFLTTPAFVDFAKRMPWFDQVITDIRPEPYEVEEWVKLFKKIRQFNPRRIYDLQGKPRQSVLFFGVGGPKGPQWSGAAPFCSHPRLERPIPGMHFTEYLTAQLQLADVQSQGFADVKWFDAPVDGFDLPERYAVLVPGSAPHRQYKRWPAQKFAKLAEKLKELGIESIAVGTAQDAEAIASVKAFYPDILDYSGRTTLFQLAGLMRKATCVIANDTGPMHIAAAVGAPVLGLMSEQVDAAWNAPRGLRAKWLQGKPLAELSVEKVLLALGDVLDQKN